jgi:hypothetical protein
MRRIILVALVATLGLLAAGLAPAALAGTPAAPYDVSLCYTLGAVETCIQSKGVTREHTSPSGTTTYVAIGRFCSQVYENGVLLDDYCEKEQITAHQQEGTTQVSFVHGSSERTIVLGGTTHTCTTSFTSVYANGAFRHQDAQLECTPPLV